MPPTCGEARDIMTTWLFKDCIIASQEPKQKGQHYYSIQSNAGQIKVVFILNVFNTTHIFSKSIYADYIYYNMMCMPPPPPTMVPRPPCGVGGGGGAGGGSSISKNSST